MRVLRLCLKGRWSWNPITLWRNIQAPGFWDQAKPSHIIAVEGTKPRWMTFDDHWVDEVSRGFKACVVFVWYPIYWLSYNQINNNLTSQAATMSTHGLPNDILNNLNPFSLIILIPIMDLFVYPTLRRFHINFSPIKKITLGFFCGALAMMCAAIVQHYIYITHPGGYYASESKGFSPLNVWVQTPSYVLIAISEIFASITGLEYAYTKAPKSMRSLVMSLFLFMSAISSAIGEAFVALSTDPLLVWNYGAMAVLAFVAGIGFWFSFRHLDSQEDELNAYVEGKFHADDDYLPHNPTAFVEK
jgi:POT family proton-dependent oligopeptide transporter